MKLQTAEILNAAQCLIDGTTTVPFCLVLYVYGRNALGFQMLRSLAFVYEYVALRDLSLACCLLLESHIVVYILRCVFSVISVISCALIAMQNTPHSFNIIGYLPPGQYALTFFMLEAISTGGKIRLGAVTMNQMYKFPSHCTRILRAQFIFNFVYHLGTLIGSLFVVFSPKLVESTIAKSDLKFDLIFGFFTVMHTLSLRYSGSTKKFEWKTSLSKFFVHSYYFVMDYLQADTKKRLSGDDIATLFLLYKVLPLFVPFILLQAAITIKYSMFIEQAERLNADLGNFGIQHPLTNSLVNPIVLVVGLPLLKFIVFPLFEKLHYPVGMTMKSLLIYSCMFVALGLAMIIECRLEKEQIQEPPPKKAAFACYNIALCAIKLIKGKSVHFVPPLGRIWMQVSLHKIPTPIKVKFECSEEEPHRGSYINVNLTAKEQEVAVYGFNYKNDGDRDHPSLVPLAQYDPSLGSKIEPTVRLVFDVVTTVNLSIRLESSDLFKHFVLTPMTKRSWVFSLPIGTYQFIVNKIIAKETKLGSTGYYTVIICQLHRKSIPSFKIMEVRPARRLPQYYQYPQLYFTAIADLFMRSPDYIYVGNKVPFEWVPLLMFETYVSSFFGHVIMSMILRMQEWSTRPLFTYFLMFTATVISTVVMAEVFLKYYDRDYDQLEDDSQFPCSTKVLI